MPNPSDDRRLCVRQTIIRKDIVEENLARLDRDLQSFSLVASYEEGRNFDVAIPLTSARSDRQVLARSLPALALIGVFLMMSAVALTWWRCQVMIKDMTGQLELVQPRAHAVRQMKVTGSERLRPVSPTMAAGPASVILRI